jgi:hypothetical protein
MTNEDLRKYVRQVLSYLKSDFSMYEESRKKGISIGAGSYLLTASSGIDFLGSLAVPEEKLKAYEKGAKGLERKSATGSKWYIETYLQKINSRYGRKGVPNFVYIALRCGQVHEGIVKRGVLIGTKLEDYHLSVLEIRESDTSIATRSASYVNTRILAQDFITSTDWFMKELLDEDQSASKMAHRLEEHLKHTPDAAKSVDLPRHQMDGDAFYDIYEYSSSSPHESQPRYSLKSHYWEEI